MRDIFFHPALYRLKRLFTTALIFVFAAIGSPGAQEYPAADPEDARAYQALLKDLEGLRLDLNRAAAGDLQALPWLSAQTARQIETYRNRAGPFRRIDDLLRVPGISPETLDAVRPYLSISARHRISGRTRWRLTRPPEHPERWNQLRIAQRTEVGIANLIAGALLTERDPGETGLVDFWSGYIAVSQVPGTTRLLLGDFRPGFGQGLIFSRQTRASTGLAWARPRRTRRIGYRSSTENGALRGLFAEGRIRRLTWTLLLSGTAWDAAVDETGHARVREGGQHVTQTQRDRKDALKEQLTALRLNCNLPFGEIATTALQAAFTPPLAQTNPNHRLLGIDWNLRLHRLTFFGEVAGGQDQAWVAGSTVQFKGLRLLTLARRYGPRFQTLRGAATSAYGTPPQNEWGLFVGAVWKPRRKTRIEAGLDRHGRIRRTGQLPLPGRGERFRLNFTHRPFQGLTLGLVLGSQRKTVRASGQIGPRIRRRAQIRLTHRRGRARLKAWIEGARAASPSRRGHGRAAGINFNIGRRPGPELALWAALFHITAYDARIYTFEPDVWGGSRLQVLTGRGQTGGVRLGWGGRHTRLKLRYSLKRTQTGVASSWAVQVELGALK